MSHDHSHHRRGLRARLKELLVPHGHGAAADHALTSSEEGIRALKLSVVALAVTAGLQAVVVALSGSVALLSDTLHNVADALTALPLWLAFSLSRRPATARFTYGYGRAEDLAGLVVLAVIALSAGLAAYEAMARFVEPRPVRNLPYVAAAALLGFAGNELVALYRIRVGRHIGSAALVADGLHARTDGLTSLAVLLGAGGVAAGFEQADPLAGLAIATVIVAILIGAGRDVLARLLDAVDPELVARVEEVVAATGGVVAVDQVHLRWIGHELRAEVEIGVAESLSVVQAHDIAVAAQHRLLHEVPRLTSAIVHASPVGTSGVDHHAPLAGHPRRFSRAERRPAGPPPRT